VPVNLLYCEGGPKSPDIRILSALVSGPCTVAPHGGKYGLGDRIRLAREIKRESNVAGLRDRDFDTSAANPTLSPIEWRVDNDRLWLGWYWERVEIENYLIDPVVVTHALGPRAPTAPDYQSALQTAAEAIADYTAAWIALSRSRVHFSPLGNCWGSKRSLDNHRFPDERDPDQCRDAIRQVVGAYSGTQFVRVDDVLNRFDAIRPECQIGGLRFQHFLTYFSGKDLLLAMQADLVRFGFESAKVFRDRLLQGIERASDDIWRWLPEWASLRTQVQTA
jgi:hypothetical protein